MPATLSAPVISLLRGMGFDGLVVSDAFDMGGLAAHFDPGEAAIRAIEAGEDQILYSADTDAAIAAVRQAVSTGRLSMARIDESCERIRRAAGGVRATRVPAEDSFERALEIARRSITLVRDDSGLLPLGNGGGGRERPPLHRTAVVTFSDEPLGHVVTGDCSPDNADVVVLLLAMRPKSGAGAISVPLEARRIAERFAKRTVVISFGSPYILRELGDVSTFVCAWGIQPVLQLAAMDAIFGRIEMKGRLPVTIFE
jgi:beta-N-acetylhexosaminidase